jgi:hypothetical protein
MRKNYVKRCLFFSGIAVVVHLMLITPCGLAEVKRCRGQVVYVPIYSISIMGPGATPS